MTDSTASRLLPPDALELPVRTVVERLRREYGEQVDAILANSSATAEGPITPGEDPAWITRTRMVGVNVRTVGTYWRVVHYLLTLPAAYDSIHLLPVWEPGVVGSLYGIASWELNDEFVDAELARDYPALASADAQLRALCAIIHLTGRSVGLDVIPHTDRFSQIVLAQPHYFEWLRRRGTKIVDHRSGLEEDAADEIYRFLESEGPADPAMPGPRADRRAFFSPAVAESVRARILFGPPDDRRLRETRRAALISRLHEQGLEPVPATMAPPYRGIEVDADTSYEDAAGRTWHDYRITRPQPMSRVFGPLTRYRFYERSDENRAWEIDFNRPREEVFAYFAGHIGDLVRRYGFDFMRGDMSHVQMRPDGVPLVIDDYYDPLRFVKRAVQASRPSFAYFAETFLSPPGVMAYGDEVDHLEGSEAEVTLGDLQSVPVGGPDFLPRLRRYLDIATTRSVVPCFTVMTGDKDDPRFDEFYLDGNEARAFLSFFLPSLPSYTALGFELRDRHEEPAPNEYYTKLYVFHEESGPKATRGRYRFGTNRALFAELARIREFADAFASRFPKVDLTAGALRWLLPPDATAGSRVVAWAAPAGEELFVFVVNTGTASNAGAADGVLAPLGTDAAWSRAELVFATPQSGGGAAAVARDRLRIARLAPGECRVYRVVSASTEGAQR